MALAKHKRNLLNAKSLVGQDFALDKEDVIHVVHKAWNDSFARAKSNQNAITEQGWMPLTYNCLLHPKILQTCISTTAARIETKNNTPNGDDSAMPSAELIQQLNLSDGLSGIIMTSIIECTARENPRHYGVNIEENRRKQQEPAHVVQDLKGKRYSTGQHVAIGKHYLGPTLLKDTRARKNDKVLKQCGLQEKRLQAFRAQERKVNEVKALGKPHEEMKLDELKVLVRMWYRQAKQDLLVPPTKPLLLARLIETCHRGDRDPSLLKQKTKLLSMLLIPFEHQGAATMVVFPWRTTLNNEWPIVLVLVLNLVLVLATNVC